MNQSQFPIQHYSEGVAQRNMKHLHLLLLLPLLPLLILLLLLLLVVVDPPGVLAENVLPLQDEERTISLSELRHV